MRYLYNIFLCVLLVGYTTTKAQIGVEYNIMSFDTLCLCTESYPTAYIEIPSFALYEETVSGFDSNQDDPIILTLPAGFEFEVSADDTILYKKAIGPAPFKDISSIHDITVTPSSLTFWVETYNVDGADFLDSIYFEGFKIRATTSATGDLLRLSGMGW